MCKLLVSYERFCSSPDWNGILFLSRKRWKKIKWKAGRVFKRSKNPEAPRTKLYRPAEVLPDILSCCHDKKGSWFQRESFLNPY